MSIWRGIVMTESPSPARIIAKATGIAIVIIAVATAGYVLLVKGPSDLGSRAKNGAFDSANQAYDLARRLAKDVDDAINFRPRITCEGAMVVEAGEPIAEFSTVEKAFEHTYAWESTWLGSTKRIKLKGHFVAKAGYDLTKPFVIDVSKDRQTIRAKMPPPKLNSVEQTKVEVLQDENGLWNRISAEERQNALNALLADARKALDSTTILADADAALLSHLEKAIRKSAPPAASIVREPLD